MNAICPLRSCADHQFITYVERDNAFYNYPIHEDDIARMPDYDKIARQCDQAIGVTEARNLEEYWIGSVGRTLYEKFIDKYNKKMWLVNDNRRLGICGRSNSYSIKPTPLRLFLSRLRANLSAVNRASFHARRNILPQIRPRFLALLQPLLTFLEILWRRHVAITIHRLRG
jgi:hypothetical protein